MIKQNQNVFWHIIFLYYIVVTFFLGFVDLYHIHIQLWLSKWKSCHLLCWCLPSSRRSLIFVTCFCFFIVPFELLWLKYQTVSTSSQIMNDNVKFIDQSLIIPYFNLVGLSALLRELWEVECERSVAAVDTVSWCGTLGIKCLCFQRG